MKTNYFYIITLFLIASLKAQNVTTYHLSEKDGLPDIEFYDMIEDSKGFIWLAADKGLYRYDGNSYKNYTNDDKKGHSVFELHEDNKGRIWCVNISGQIFYVEKDQLITVADLGHLTGGELPDYIVKGNYIYIFLNRKILIVNTVTKALLKKYNYRIVGKPTVINDSIYFIVNEEVHTIHKDVEVKKVMPIKAIERNNISIGAKIMKTSMFTKKNKLYGLFSLIEENVLIEVNLNKKETKKIVIPNKLRNLRFIHLSIINDKLWIATDEGVYVCSILENILKIEEVFLESEFVTKAILDQNENYWFTTKLNGIFVIPNIHTRYYPLLEDKKISVLHKIDDAHFAYGTMNGEIGIYNIENNTVRVKELPLNQKVHAITYNSETNKIYLSQDTNSYIIDAATFLFKKNKYYANAKSLTLLDNGIIAYSSYSLAKVLDVENLLVLHEFGEGEIIKRSYTSHYSKREDKIYIAYVDELKSYSGYNKKAKQKKIRYKGSPIFTTNITETSNGMLWASSFKNGLYGIKKDSVVINITEDSGLLSNKTNIIKGDGIYLWIATENGLQLLNTETNTLKNLTKRDGLPSYFITGIEVFNDQVFIGSNKGVSSINKEYVFKKRKAPEVYFTSVIINEKEATIGKNYELDYDKNSLKFNFNANGFQSNENITYQHRLIGSNDNWLTLGKRENSVKYNSLPAGNYTFEVKAIDNAIPNKSIVKQIKFSIKTPFWKSWWFITIIVISMLLIVWMYYTQKIKKLRLKQKTNLERERVNRQLIASQLENLRSQMNPHFIFNALNSIQEYIVLNEKELASSYLVKFSRLIRMYLEHSQKQEVTLKEELEALSLYLTLEQNRFEDVLEYKIKISSEVPVNSIKVPSLFIQPYVENALKHGLLHKKENRLLIVALSLDNEQNHLICRITDNGIGRKASKLINNEKRKQHTSFATAANEKRIDLINTNRKHKIVVNIKDLFSESNKPIGTQVEIIIPIKS